MRHSPLRALTSLALIAISSAAIAPTHSRAQDDAAVVEARARFQRAITLFDEGRIDAALIEFEAAYARAGHFALLYNIGSCHRALGHPVEAVDAWERYLRDGGDEVDPARRTELEAALVEQRGRIGTVVVTTNVYGARITVDGVSVGTAPLGAPLRLAVGQYSIGAEVAGYQGPVQRVTVAGQSEQTLEIQLDEVVQTRGSLRILSAIPGVEVRVDQRTIGVTPLPEGTVPVSPGQRVVEGRRDGFRSFRQTVTVENQQELEVRIEMPVDEDASDALFGRVRLRIPNAPSELHVNGVEVVRPRDALRLPAGPHAMRLHVDEREELRWTIEVEAGASSDVAPELSWTEDGRARRLSGAGEQQTIGAVILGVGLLTTAFGAVAAPTAEVLYAEQIAANEPGWIICTETGMLCGDDEQTQREAYDVAEASLMFWRVGYGIALGAGLAVATVGAVLVLTAPSADAIDRGARVELRAGPGGLLLDGQF